MIAFKHIIFKQEARGSHRLHEKKFQPINRFAQSYTITLIKRERKNPLHPFWEINGPLFCLKLSPLYPRMLCAKFRRNWPSGSEDLKVSSNMYFRYFVIMSPWGRTCPFVWTNLNSIHLRMVCAKFCWNWTSGFRDSEDENVKSLQTVGHTTDDRRSEKITWAVGSDELKIKVCFCSSADAPVSMNV